MEELVSEALRESRKTTPKMAAGDESFQTPRIVVIGTGGAGCNSVNRLARAGIRGAELIAINTDKLHLTTVSESVKKVLIGASITRGLGAGGYPEVGMKAADVSREPLEKLLSGTDLVFLTCGMGGGTGTGKKNQICST